MPRSRDDRTAKASQAAFKVFADGQAGPRSVQSVERVARIEDRWPLATTVHLPESPGCHRVGQIRAWRP